jgi:hypothetical protein
VSPIAGRWHPSPPACWVREGREIRGKERRGKRERERRLKWSRWHVGPTLTQPPRRIKPGSKPLKDLLWSVLVS